MAVIDFVCLVNRGFGVFIKDVGSVHIFRKETYFHFHANELYGNIIGFTAILDDTGRTYRRFSYDRKGRLMESIEGEAVAGTRYVYDVAGRLIQKWMPVREEGAVLYNVTLYEYDAAGNRILERRSTDEVREGSMPVHYLDIRYTYDRQNRLVQVEDSFGAAVTYTYDCLNNRLSEKYRVSEDTYRLICYKYDAAGRLIDRMESVDAEDVGQQARPYCKKAFLHTK